MGDHEEELPASLVRRGWDRAGPIYRSDPSGGDVFGRTAEEYHRWLQPLLEEIPEGAPVLDLGCGNGVPTSAILARRFRVTGVDISGAQIARARQLVPTATFVQADMAEVAFPARSFHAAVCLYSLIHVPLPAQRPLLRKVHDWLVPNGLLLLITGHDAWEGIEEDWLGSGAPMFWSHADAATYREWLTTAGFAVHAQEFVPEGEGGHELFRARST